jgi:hypothetical protein
VVIVPLATFVGTLDGGGLVEDEVVDVGGSEIIGVVNVMGP